MDLTKISNDYLKNLSEEEKKVVFSILKEYSEKGYSKEYSNLLYSDFDEIPVTIETFLHDKKYLGNALYDQDGRFTVFPYWEEKLKEIFPTNIETKYNTMILTGCLAYDTEISLLNGKNVKIGDLARQGDLDEYVYSYDVETNSYVPGHLVAAFSTGKKPVYNITLDNGTVIKATANHQFMTRDKHWKSIETGLAIGDSMMPFNRKLGTIANRNGYEIIENPNKDGTTTDIFTHRLVMNWKRGDYDGVVHHIDFNKNNNDPRNLVLTDWMTHKMYHAKRGGDRWREFNKKRANKEIPQELEQQIRDGALKGCLNRWSKETEHQKMSDLTTSRMNDGLAKEMTYIVWNGKNAELNRQRSSATITAANKDKNKIKQYQISKAIKISSIALVEFGELTETTYEKVKLLHNMRSGYPSFKSILKRITFDELLAQAQTYNHKILKIEYAGEEEVYDLTVDKYHNFAINNGIIAHNSIGIGKSTTAVICLLYLLYRLLCLKDPYLYYGLQPIDKITISLMNITIENAKGVALDKMNQMIMSSSWFMAHGKMTGVSNLVYVPDKHIELITASSNNQVIGRAVFANFSDEVNWGLTTDTEKLKTKYKQLISQIDARMKSRFMRTRGNETYLPTLNIIASSKNSEQSFLEDYIETKKKNESTNTLIVDEPQWVVDKRKDSDIKFFVAIGNKFLANELLPLNCPKDLLDEYRAKGYTILEVPIGYLENFQDNIDGALMDIAGIATAASLKYISGMRWNDAKTALYENPFSKEIITVGTAKDDLTQYSDFFDLSKVPDDLKVRPLYIHLDMSKSGDKTGISGVYVIGKKPKVENESSSNELFYRIAFNVSIAAPKGYEISFDKNRAFIRWLREQGFNIKGVSSDTYQSGPVLQQLAADGFNTKIISVDRLDTETKQCLPYVYFKSTLYDRRLEVYKECDFLTEEVLGLERQSDGHINHPEGGTKGSKDAIDAVVGALWNASQNAEQYAYEYGEDINVMLDIAENKNTMEKEQLAINLSEELLKIMRNDTSDKIKQADDDYFKNISWDPSLFDGFGIM